MPQPVRERSSQTRPHRRATIAAHTDDPRWQHELREMQETHDLRDIDDDVEDASTLFEWYAEEHNHRPRSPRWFITLAVAATIVAGIFLYFANFIGVISVVLVSGLIYYIAQKEPAIVRYRIMVDGAAINTLLYHYRDLEAFNIVYEPNETRTVILRSKRPFTPLLHLELGETDPVIVRDLLLEFLPEDQELDEPLTDVVARRLGF